MYLRNKDSWLTSWKTQVQPVLSEFGDVAPATKGVFDFSRSTWLLDDKTIKLFGKNTVSLSYETALEEEQSVIPSFLRALGLNENDCPGWDGVWANSSSQKMKRTDNPSSQLASNN